MIAGPLVTPIVVPPSQPRAGVAARVVGVALVVLALTGAWAWFTVLSPFAFDRWEVFETSRTVELEAGSYAVFEEFPDASGATTRRPLAVIVRSIAGREITVTPAIGTEAPEPAPETADPYRTPWHEGRATAVFQIDRAGMYTVTAFPADSRTTRLDYNTLLTSFVALAPAGGPGPLGSTWGLVALTLVPLVAGAVVLVVARFRWPRPRTGRSRRYPAPVS